MKTNDNNRDAGAKKAVFAAAIQATDSAELQECIQDIMKTANVDKITAKTIALAARAKHLPNMARKAGLSEDEIAQIMAPLHNEKTVDFADEKEPEDEEINEETEESPEHEAAETPEFEAGEQEEESEEAAPEVANDEEEMPIENNVEGEDLNDEEPIAQINIEVPASMVDAIKQAIESVVGGDSLTEETAEGETAAEGPEMMEEPEEVEVPEVEAPEVEGSDLEFDNESDINSRSEEMDKKTLAQRKAAREAILAKVRTAAENTDDQDRKPKDIGLGKDTSFNGKPYQFSDKAQYEGEDEYPKMTMQNSEGNSLKDDPGFVKVPIPTNNPENLQLTDAYETKKLDGTPDGSLEYSVDFDKVDFVPSAGETATDKKFEVPTQLNLPKNKTTVAKIVECMGCNNPDGADVETVQCPDCGEIVRLCTVCQDDDFCPVCAAKVEKTACKDDPKCNCDKEKKAVNVDVDKNDLKDEIEDIEVAKTENAKKAAVWAARFRVACKTAAQLVMAKILTPAEYDDQVDIWMRDGLSGKAITAQANLMIRCASNAAERIASASMEQNNVRTASTKTSIATNPSFVSVNSAPTQYNQQDLTTILQGMFMSNLIKEEEL